MPTNQLNPWPDVVVKTLCELLKMYGFECGPLESPQSSARRLLDAYGAQGVPKFNSPTDKDEFLNNLGILQQLLADPANDLPAATTSALNVMIDDLDKQIG